jgi:hypothetical protein
MRMLILAGYLVFVFVLLVVIVVLSRRVRVAHPACPCCAHSVQGLTEARCTECGSSLEPGVVREGGLRPTPAMWLSSIALLLGVVLAFVSYAIMHQVWPGVLRSIGVIYLERTVERQRELGIGNSNRLKVLIEAVYPAGTIPSGDIRVVVTGRDGELASWAGTQRLTTQPQEGMVIDAAPIVASLRAQVPAESGSPFAPLLHDPDDAAILKRAIEALAAPKGSVSTSWRDSRGERMFDGIVSLRSNSGSRTVNPYGVWYIPVYVLPLAILAGFLLIAMRIFQRGRSLVPFSPYDAPVLESSAPH